MTDELPYDGDLNDPRQRCRHGTFIGSWWGPDYLCQWCESGEEPDEPLPPLPPTTVTLMWDSAPNGTQRYVLMVDIDGETTMLGDYATSGEAGAAMLRWLTDRGLTTALGSGRRLSEAQRMRSVMVTLDVVRRDPDA